MPPITSRPSRRAQSVASKPYVFMGKVRKLSEVYKSYVKVSAELLDKLDDVEEHHRASRKAEHYNELVDYIINEE